MRSFFNIFLFSFFAYTTAFGQDTLYTKEKEKLEVKMLEINKAQGTAKYQLNSDPLQYTYIILTKDIEKIVHKDGLITIFTKNQTEDGVKYNTKKGTKTEKSDPFDTRNYALLDSYKENLVTYNTFDLIFKNVTFSYERIVTNGYIGIKFPFSFGIGKDGTGNKYQVNKIVSGGLDLNFYIGGQKTNKIYFGPSLEIGKFLYAIPESNSIRNSNAQPLSITYTAILCNFGIISELDHSFAFCTFIGLGAKFDKYSDYYNYYAVPSSNAVLAWNFGLNIGYRF